MLRRCSVEGLNMSNSGEVYREWDRLSTARLAALAGQILCCLAAC
jgi:hypothetical protein